MPTRTETAARRKFINDPPRWALYCLTTADSHEAIRTPLAGTPELLANGWARVQREYEDAHYRYRVITITDAGRAELARAMTEP